MLTILMTSFPFLIRPAPAKIIYGHLLAGLKWLRQVEIIGQGGMYGHMRDRGCIKVMGILARNPTRGVLILIFYIWAGSLVDIHSATWAAIPLPTVF